MYIHKRVWVVISFLMNMFIIYTKKIAYLLIFGLGFIYCIFLNFNNLFVSNKISASVMQSRVNIIDWKLIIFKILQDVCFFNIIENNNILLVNIVKNNTNGDIQVNKITDLLIKCILDNTKRYKVICIEQLYCAYRELGVFPEDHINSYSFSVDIANYLRANYVLYSIIWGDSEYPFFQLQLISVKTGEILKVINKAVL